MAENRSELNINTARREPDSPVVSVACKLGIAWLDIQACVKTVVQENTQTGPRDKDMWQKSGPIHRIRGTAYPAGAIPDGFFDRPEMIAGHAITRNVPRKLWDTWFEQNAQSDMVRNGLIFAFVGMDDIKARSREMENVPSGLEPIKRGRMGPEGEEDIIDPRLPKPSIGGLSTSGMRKAG